MGWLLLAAAAVAVFVFAKKSGSSFETFQNDASTGGVPGTWGFRAVVGSNGITNNGPYASQAAAAAAAGIWISQNTELPPNIVTPIPDPINLPPPQQGGPAVLPYLFVNGQGVVGSAVVEGERVRWTAGDETDTTSNVLIANSTLLARVDTKAVPGTPVLLQLRRSGGDVVRGRVGLQNGTWIWALLSTPANGPSSWQTEAAWKANSRLAAMRGALSTMQDA